MLTGGLRLRRAIYVPKPQVRVPTYYQSRAPTCRLLQGLTVADTDIHL